jgi:hypothetical protein
MDTACSPSLALPKLRHRRGTAMPPMTPIPMATASATSSNTPSAPFRLQTSPAPWTATTASGYLGLSISKNASASGLTWSAESSDDLITWHPEQTVTLIDNSTTFSVRDSEPMNTTTRRFIRLRVTTSP